MLRLIYLSLVAGAWMLVTGSSFASAATWSIQSTPNASGAEHSALYDIACAPGATNPCVSVGKQIDSKGKSAPYVQAWNGTTWTNIAAGVPEGATAGELQSVDCAYPAEILFCYAAGSYTSSGVTKTLIVEGGSGSMSSVKSTPNPEGASESVLKGMACKTLGQACIAVGYSVKAGKKTALVLGQTLELKWAIQTMPEPEGAVSSELHGIDCTATPFCIAVGSYVDGSGKEWAMSATWSGTSWTLKTVAKPTGEPKGSILLDVSCASSSSCTGVGGYRNSSNVQVSLVERWNGTSWSHQSSPNPVGSTNTVFQGVSCISGALCVAVGDWFNGKWQPMAQEWTGAAWALDTTPTPVGASFSLLEGGACSATTCLASGWYTDSGGKNKTLGEKR